MYNKSQDFRSSNSRGASYRGNSSFNRPSRNGNRFGGGRPKSRMFRDINMFIKKAIPGQEPIIVESTHKFSDFGFATPLQDNINKRGYLNPTPIQDQAIKPIMEGRDLIGLANTGTGKTAAFLLPIINKIFLNRDQKALIVAPTRELAAQIREELVKFSEGMRIYSTVVIGGASMQRQIFDLRRNPHVVIATPGRLKDLIQRRALRLDDFGTIVLDEVDLMVDIGFINDVKYFVSLLPKERQSLFFSATISPKIQDILRDFVKDPVTVSLKQQSTASNIDQDVVRVTNKEKKVDQLHDLLIQDGFDKVLIFGRTKHGVEKLNSELELRGFKTGAIHGNKTQGHRQRVLQSFKRNDIKILLATDVASRGLDIDNVTHVINYELPETYEDYIHRIGRTGRANKKGIALTFID